MAALVLTAAEVAMVIYGLWLVVTGLEEETPSWCVRTSAGFALVVVGLMLL